MVPQSHPQRPASSSRVDAILTYALVFLASLASLASIAGPLAAQTATQDPEALPARTGPLTVAEQLVDLGNVGKNIIVPHEWTLTNTADRPVTLERVFASPGCSAPSYDETIPAGGQTVLRTEVNTALLNGKASCIFGVLLAGDEEPSLMLELDLRVVPQLLAHPGYARWIYVQHEVEGTIRQTVFPADGAEFDVTGVSSPVDSIRLSFREAKADERREDTPGSQWIVEATLDDEAPVGPIEGQIVVETTHPSQKTLRIPISGFVRPVLFVQPPAARLGALASDQVRHMVFDVRNFATEEIRLTDIATDVAGVTPSIQTVDDGRRYRLVVVFDPEQMKSGPFSGTLQVTTDSERVPTLEVPLSGSLRPSDLVDESRP